MRCPNTPAPSRARSPAPGQDHGSWPAATPQAPPTPSPRHAWTAESSSPFRFPVDTRVQRIVEVIPEACWHPALQTDHGDGTDLRDGAWVAEATGMIDLSGWPAGSRLVLRKQTTPPRRAADLHRCRRHAHHRATEMSAAAMTA